MQLGILLTAVEPVNSYLSRTPVYQHPTNGKQSSDLIKLAIALLDFGLITLAFYLAHCAANKVDVHGMSLPLLEVGLTRFLPAWGPTITES
jgi:hypothetical protein